MYSEICSKIILLFSIKSNNNSRFLNLKKKRQVLIIRVLFKTNQTNSNKKWFLLEIEKLGATHVALVASIRFILI